MANTNILMNAKSDKYSLQGMRKLNEVNLSRILSHKDKNGFLIISGKKGEDSEAEGILSTKKLAKEFYAHGYGYVFIDGHYSEKQNGEWVDFDAELSLFIPAKDKGDITLKELAIKLMNDPRYKQNSSLWADGKGGIVYLKADGSISEKEYNTFNPVVPASSKEFGEKNPEATEFGHSTLKNQKRFTFESMFNPVGWIGKKAFASEGHLNHVASTIENGKGYGQKTKRLDEDFRTKIAYWINPYGKIMPVRTNHITDVITHPEDFRTTREEVDEIHKKHNEKLGVEGNAREELIVNAIKKGFIRVRYYSKKGMWTLNIYRLDNKVKDIIQQWATQMLADGSSGYDDVILDMPTGRVQHSLKSLSHDVLYSEQKYVTEPSKIVLEFVDTFENNEIPFYIAR